MSEDTRSHGSSSEEEMRERMRAVGYANWEIDDEIEESIAVSEHVRANTEHYREHGTFVATVPPIQQMKERGEIVDPAAPASREEMRSCDVVPEEATMRNVAKESSTQDNGFIQVIDDPYLSARIALRESLIEHAGNEYDRETSSVIAELSQEIDDRYVLHLNDEIIRDCRKRIIELDNELGASLDAGDNVRCARIEDEMERERVVEQNTLAEISYLASRHPEWKEQESLRAHLNEVFIAETDETPGHYDVVDDREPTQVLAQIFPGEAENTWSAVIIDGAVHFGEQCFNSPEEAFDYAENNVTGITPKQMQMNASRVRHGQSHSVPDTPDTVDLASMMKRYEQAAEEFKTVPQQHRDRSSELELTR